MRCLLLLLLLLGACARLPGEDSRGTPAEAAARRGFAQLALGGVALGSAVAVAPERLLTAAHVLPAGAERLGFRRGDGLAAGEARLLARSPRMDLALLAVPPVFEPVPQAAAPVRAGDRLWAAGSPAAGAAVSSGEVLRPAVHLPGHGPGFTARLGALLGYSGGPAVDAEGRLVGMVTALPQPGVAPLLAALSGLDLDGLARGGAGREVFLLGIEEIRQELGRLAAR